jgi:2'-5' RNA ligase
MYAAATLLNATASRQTEEYWSWLETRCGLSGIKLTPLPHFSWQGARDYHLDKAEEVLRDIAARQTPFSVRASALGLFPGANPVLFLSLVKTRRLLELHEEIWQRLHAFAITPNDYYEPSQWMPHITLAYRDVTPENMGCAMQLLAFQPVNVSILVNHLAMIYEADGEIGIKFRYDFAG